MLFLKILDIFNMIGPPKSCLVTKVTKAPIEDPRL